MMTLEEALKQNRGVGPGFHMLRHLLSLVIVAHHCRAAIIGEQTVNTYEKGAALTTSVASHLTWGQLLVEFMRPGLFALVGMFFALSGFLVFGSAVRNSDIRVFFANRALRILPALTVEVTLSALVLGPLVTTLPLSDYFADPKFFSYFGNIVGHITFLLPGVFETNPWPDIVNANLWTLPPEFWCYFLMLLLMWTGAIVRHKWLTYAIVIALLVCSILSFSGLINIRAKATHFKDWYLVLMFFFGVLLYVNSRFVMLHPIIFIASALGYYLMMALNYFGPLSGFLLAYCTVYIGFMSFPKFDRLVSMDLSYGTYLYGFPITQGVIYFMQPHLSGVSVGAKYARDSSDGRRADCPVFDFVVDVHRASDPRAPQTFFTSIRSDRTRNGSIERRANRRGALLVRVIEIEKARGHFSTSAAGLRR